MVRRFIRYVHKFFVNGRYIRDLITWVRFTSECAPILKMNATVDCVAHKLCNEFVIGFHDPDSFTVSLAAFCSAINSSKVISL